VAVVVVYFRTPTNLAACLDSLRQQTRPPKDVVVIDNSSVLDGSHQRPGSGEDWRWVRAERNLGFGAACNLGAGLTQSDYILFLNADVVLAESACDNLRSVAEVDLGVAVVGPRLYGEDGEIELSARAFPGAITGVAGRSSRLTRVLSALDKTPAGLSGALGASRYVDWISGACMLVRRSAFEQVAGFDEGYWMYWEDADICRRLKDRGWQMMFCPSAGGCHRTGSSGTSPQTIQAFHESAARYYERHVARSTVTARLARYALRVRLRLIRGGRARRRVGR
jgi:GT2 family glycosyltransferase